MAVLGRADSGHTTARSTCEEKLANRVDRKPDQVGSAPFSAIAAPKPADWQGGIWHGAKLADPVAFHSGWTDGEANEHHR